MEFPRFSLEGYNKLISWILAGPFLFEYLISKLLMRRKVG
jgi:hypothetical protein